MKSTNDKENVDDGDPKQSLTKILSSIATRFDKEVEHDVTTSVLERSDKQRSQLREAMNMQVTFYKLLRETTDRKHCNAIENKIDMLEDEITMLRTEILEKRRMLGDISGKSPGVVTLPASLACSDDNDIEVPYKDDDNAGLYDEVPYKDDNNVGLDDEVPLVVPVPCTNNKKQVVGSHHKIVEVTIPPQYDEVSCLNQSQDNTYVRYESPDLLLLSDVAMSHEI